MNFEDNFVPETTTTETIKAGVRSTTLTDTLILPDTIVVMPDKIVKANFETTSIENMVSAPEDESQNKELALADLLPWDERTKDIILMSIFGACLVLVIVLGIVTFKWRKEKVHVVNGFDMLSRGSSVSIFNSSKIA